MLILGSLEALQPIQTWSHARAVSSIQELRSCTCTSPSHHSVCCCVYLCSCVYLCVPVLLCNCVRCICKLLLAHIAASIQFRNGREEKNFGTFETSLQLLESQCALQRSHHSEFEAVFQSLEVIFHQ